MKFKSMHSIVEFTYMSVLIRMKTKWMKKKNKNKKERWTGALKTQIYELQFAFLVLASFMLLLLLS